MIRKTACSAKSWTAHTCRLQGPSSNAEEEHEDFQRTRFVYVGAAMLALIVALGVGQALLQKTVDAQGRTVQAPVFEVDPLWPKPLPNHWLLGSTIGVWVDEEDNVWIIHRSSATLNDNEKALVLKVGECCRGHPRAGLRSRGNSWAWGP